MRPVTRIALILIVALAATGCAGKRTNITGTITRDGKPLVWPKEGGHLLVLFVPVERSHGEEPFLAEVDKEAGTYRIAEIKSGTYIVAVHMFDDKHMDALRNKFDPAHSPLRAEVTDDNQVIDVELPKELPE